jgi:hypothetical protein
MLAADKKFRLLCISNFSAPEFEAKENTQTSARTTPQAYCSEFHDL